MPEAVDTSGKVVIDHGPYSRVASGEVTRYQPGRVVVLSGKGGYRVVSADEPISLLQRWIETYSHYSTVDTTAKQTVRSFRHTHTSDPRYSFDIQVTMSAKVEDPVAFLQDFGPNASVFDAFYNELIEDVANTLAECPVNDLGDTQQRLSDYAKQIKQDQPYYKGVKIHQFNVVVRYGPELLKRVEVFDLQSKWHKGGEEELIFDGAGDAKARERNQQLIKDLRESQANQHQTHLTHSKTAIELAQQYADAVGIDLRKVARESGLDRRINAALEPPPSRQEPRGFLFSSQIRAQPPNAQIASSATNSKKKPDGPEEAG